MNVLFIARNYPPAVGGMERYSHDLYNSLKKDIRIDLFENTRGRNYLPIFLLHCLIYLTINRKKYTHIHFSDGVLAPVGIGARLVTGATLSITIHSLDIVYDKWFYQNIIPYCVNKFDKVVCVSHYAVDQCLKRGIQKNRCVFLPNAINYDDLPNISFTLEDLESRYNLSLQGKKILFSIGRLIRRKGIAWFVSEVMPKLPSKFVYIIAGEGPEYNVILKSVKDNNLEGRVFLLGKISEEEKSGLYENACLFIMPNISITGDAEGFGITLLEAAAYGLPSIAASLEGIPDAVIDGVTGRLIEPGNNMAFIEAINKARFDTGKIKEIARQKYNWANIKSSYIKIFENAAGS